MRGQYTPALWAMGRMGAEGADDDLVVLDEGVGKRNDGPSFHHQVDRVVFPTLAECCRRVSRFNPRRDGLRFEQPRVGGLPGSFGDGSNLNEVGWVGPADEHPSQPSPLRPGRVADGVLMH